MKDILSTRNRTYPSKKEIKLSREEIAENIERVKEGKQFSVSKNWHCFYSF